MMSTGSPFDQAAGSALLRLASVSGASAATTPPRLSSASAASTPAPPPFERMASRSPRTCIPDDSVVTASNSSRSSNTRSRPARRNAAS